MPIAKFPDLFRSCVLWWPGESQQFKLQYVNATIDTSVTKFSSTSLNSIGAGSYATYSDGTFMQLGSGDSTIEFWFYWKDNSDTQSMFEYVKTLGAPNDYMRIGWTPTAGGYFTVGWYVGGTEKYSIDFTGLTPTANAWHFLQVVRSGTTVTLWVDGVSRQSRSCTGSLSGILGGIAYFGRCTSLGAYRGYLSDFRVSNVARSTTVPTAALTSDANTLLLISDWGNPRFNSNSPDLFPIIPSGVTVTPAGVWTKDDLGTNKSVMRFDGSTNYVSLNDNAAWAMFEADFSITGWFRMPALNGVYIGQQDIAGSETDYWYFQWMQNSGFIELKGKTSNVDNFSYRAIASCAADTWYHLTVVRSGTSCFIYVNAVSQSVTAYQAFRNTTDIAQPLQIGWSWSYQKGNTKDLLIYKGRALTVPEIKLIMARTHPTTGAGMIPGPYDYYRVIS